MKLALFQNAETHRQVNFTYGWMALAMIGCILPYSPHTAFGETDRPNIVILFADDLGYSDIGCFGGEIQTPNLDQLAYGGIRLTQFYNTGRCCPSRACLLTGLYPHQAGIGLMVYRNYPGEGYLGHLNDQCVTIGNALGTAGYQTYMVGKWHAGHLPKSRPEVRGFDHFTGIYIHIDSYWKVLKGCDIYRDGELMIEAQDHPVNPYRPSEEFYTTDFFTDAACDYIDQATTKEGSPFLLHVCYNTPHFPLEAPDELIEKYRGQYEQGWDVLRAEKFNRMRKMGLLGAGQILPRGRQHEEVQLGRLPFKTLVDRDFLPAWDDLSQENREELDFRRAIYAAQVDRMDQGIGKIVERLKERGVLENTVIMFFSDNGCSGELDLFGMNWPEYKRSNYQAWRTKGGWSVSQGQCWANFSNTPLRKYKQYVHEGGIASPFLVHWPAGIKDQGQIVDQQPFHLIDVMPTLCDLARADYPDSHRGEPINSAEGISMVPYWNGDVSNPPERTLYWQHLNHSAIRQGDWKLVTLDDREPTSWELYNLSKDRSETVNVIRKHQAKATKLHEAWNAWAHKVDAVPFPEDRGPSTYNHIDTPAIRKGTGN